MAEPNTRSLPNSPKSTTSSSPYVSDSPKQGRSSSISPSEPVNNYSTPNQMTTDEQRERRKIVGIGRESVTNTVSTDYPGNYWREDHSWNIEKFKENLKVVFHRNKALHAEFDIIGVDAGIANAFRRILLSEIPSLAIEDVYVADNTSIMQDEVLAHRIGLIPLVGDKDGFKHLRWKAVDAEATDYNTIVLSLKTSCKINPTADKNETDPKKAYEGSSVYASSIKFVPQGRQTEWFPNADSIRPANPECLIVKLRPGQNVDLMMHCRLGVGSDHAKFSPVATASYRLMPWINIKKPILGQEAEMFARCFPRGVIKIEKDDETGEKKAVVNNPRKDTVSREVLRYEELASKVELGRVQDHFIFTIESTGMYNSEELFLQSVQVLRQKCSKFREKLLEQ